jgi:hypothetical protein
MTRQGVVVSACEKVRVVCGAQSSKAVNLRQNYNAGRAELRRSFGSIVPFLAESKNPGVGLIRYF